MPDPVLGLGPEKLSQSLPGGGGDMKMIAVVHRDEFKE